MNFEIAPKSTEAYIKNWDDARLYCFSLDIDGKVGWRLPTREELNEIYQSENDFGGSYYWSSTEGIGDYAWMQSFNSGGQTFNLKSIDILYVRAIRDLT